MGSLFKSSTPAPTPPAPPSTVRDEINGVEQVPVKNADGSITYITRAIPLTAEQKAQKEQLDAIMAESLVEIQKLSSSDYAMDADTQRILSQWQSAQNELLSTQVTKRTASEEETLARRGLTDSTAASDVRRQRVLDQQQAEKNISLMSDEMASQIRNEQLSLQQNLYNLAANQTDVAAARTAQAAAKAQSTALAINAQRQASLLDYYGGGSAFGDSFNTALGSSLGKSVVTGVGSMLGSLFSSKD
ncbi:MAG: hypothetical protein DI585_05540 [Pseudomonas fluorescens]|nr:MAG: hypothetical protein DI585_05540 [Pseudomonas fluorescens]